MPDKNFAERTVVSHPGAVAVVALDDASRVLMIRQYRHPVGYQLWEIPAGLRDAAGEPPLETARRELFEETGYRAREWHVLIDYFTSPGFTTERLRIYLARGVHPAGGRRRRGLRPPRRGEVPRQQVGPARRGGPPGVRGQAPQQRRHHRRPRRPVSQGNRLPQPPPRRRPRTLARAPPCPRRPPRRRVPSPFRPSRPPASGSSPAAATQARPDSGPRSALPAPRIPAPLPAPPARPSRPNRIPRPKDLGNFFLSGRKARSTHAKLPR